MAEGRGNSPWASLASAGITAVGNAITRGGPKRQFKYNKKMMEEQNRINRENAEWAFDKELELKRFQMDYDTPQAQMQRYKDAGLNPNLIYGSGSAAAGSFEAPSAPHVQGVSAHSIDAAVLGNLGTEFQQARLMASQADLTQERVTETASKRDLNEAQAALVKANPYLQEGYVKAMVSQLEAVAALKQQESGFMLSKVTGQEMSNGYLKMQAQVNDVVAAVDLKVRELKLKETDQVMKELGIRGWEMDQDLKFSRKLNIDADTEVKRNQQTLQRTDSWIKAEVLKSKQFQNVLDEIAVDWMRDGDFTPEHIRQGIMLLLQQLMKK